MFERVVFDKKSNMKGDEELERLLDEIPHATTSHHLHHHHQLHQQQQQQQHHINNDIHGGHGHGMYGLYDDYDDPSRHHYKYTCASPVSGFSLQSDGSSSSLLSNGHSSLSDNGPPTPPPPLEELKSQMPYYPNGLWLNSITPDSPVRNKTNESLIDELGLCRNLSTMYITNEQEDLSLEPNRLNLHDQINIEKYGAYGNMRRRFSDYGGFQSSVPRSDMSTELLGMQQEWEMSNLLGMRVSPYRSDALFSQLNGYNSPVSSPWQKTKEQTGNFYQRGGLVPNLNTPLSRLSIADALFYTQRNEINWNEERGALNLPNSPQLNHPSPHLSLENVLHCGLPLSNGRTRVPSNMNIQQRGLEPFTSEDSFIISGEGLNYMVSKGLHHSRGQNKGTVHDIGVSKCLERKSQLNGQHQIADICGNARSSKLSCPSSLPPKYNSLAEARGNIYLIAKDQYGCRFLQRMFDEGTRQDVQIIFNEIIEHVVELMVNPFGNYLMQKLLEVCNEEQRMQILVMVTLEPGELVRISLDSHGTRVVQKLIETLKTRQQICLVISALKTGFLALIKDLNGNHVVQRCLQCLSNEDNKFIFVAAAKYCVDIATHQHGCCVLQRCISHSNGEYREKLVAEISANGLLLAQDAYGNYVIQFILELKIPSAHFNLISQFEGNYVHLSTQKFSSHVVEKCLLVFNDESRSRIIHELLSASHFEQLLQDPHANYVVQTALRVSEGPLHNSLVATIETHKAISRNSPYSKRIFSQKLLKK